MLKIIDIANQGINPNGHRFHSFFSTPWVPAVGNALLGSPGERDAVMSPCCLGLWRKMWSRRMNRRVWLFEEQGDLVEPAALRVWERLEQSTAAKSHSSFHVVGRGVRWREKYSLDLSTVQKEYYGGCDCWLLRFLWLFCFKKYSIEWVCNLYWHTSLYILECLLCPF